MTAVQVELQVLSCLIMY